MKNCNMVKRTWAVSNLFFVTNYSIYLLLYIIKIPIHPFPQILNILSLVISYSTSLTKCFNNIGGIFEESNFYCILVFITFPRNILLLPFYFLSVYHLITFILSNKSCFEKYWIYGLCRSLSNIHVVLGRIALMAEVVCCALSFVLFFTRFGSLGTFVAYGVMIRQQYYNNPNMRSVLSELRMRTDEMMKYMPVNVQKYYVSGRDYLISTHQKSE